MQTDVTKDTYCELHRTGASIKYKKIQVLCRLQAARIALDDLCQRGIEDGQKDVKEYIELYEAKQRILDRKELEISLKIVNVEFMLSFAEVTSDGIMNHIKNRKHNVNVD